jgi:hypothetical protein
MHETNEDLLRFRFAGAGKVEKVSDSQRYKINE